MAGARLILVCGLPGSGKTTLAKELAPKVPAVRLSPDEWKHDLGIDYYDEQGRVRLENRLWRLGQELLALGPECDLGVRLLGPRGAGRAPAECASAWGRGGTALPGSAGQGVLAAAAAS